MAQGKSVKVRMYLKPELFAEVAQEAEKAGKRKKGLLLYTQRAHGFATEKDANTDGIAKFFKHCYDYWRAHEAQRLQELAEVTRQEHELAERRKKLSGA